MPIDYSKWDHLEGDSESDEDDPNVTGPRVTRLDAASSVTFGGQQRDGWSTSLSPSSRAKDSSTSTSTAGVGTSTTKATSDAPSKLSPAARPLNQWTANGGSFITADDRNLSWSQDRYSVHIRLELHRGEAIERVHVNGILPYSDRYCATGSHKHHLNITGTKTSATTQVFSLIQGDLPHPVHWSQEDDSEAETLDWEIERHPSDFQRRFVSIALHKAAPMNGLFVWWNCPLMQFDLPLSGKQSDQDIGFPGHSKEFLQTWEEAHRLFREKKRPQTTAQPM